MPTGRRVWIVGDVYSAAPTARNRQTVGVYDRLERVVYLWAHARAPVTQDVALWSLTGFAHALNRDAEVVRAELARVGLLPGSGVIALNTQGFAAWFEQGGNAAVGAEIPDMPL